MNRGEIWWADLDEPENSEPGGTHPLLIVQSDAFNRSKIQTTIALVISSNSKLREAPGNVLLPKKQSGLAKESVANVSQLVTIDKSWLKDYVGTLPAGTMQDIDMGIRLVLSV